MKKDHDFDRLLRRTARADDVVPQGGCLDAETLAAWMEGSLTSTERTAVEAHAADCARCLDALSAMAKTTPPRAASRPLWRPIRWLAPLATAAAAITIWMLVQDPWATPSRTVSVAPASPQSSTSEPIDALKRSAPPASEAKAERDEAALQKKQGVLQESAAPKSPTANVPPATAATPRAAGAPPPLRDEARNTVFMAGARPEQSRTVASPDPDVLWRLAGTTIERSSDRGRSWHAQSTGTSVDLLAGSSPAPTVCWVVGRAGTVLLSTDGRTWRSLDFPDKSADVTGVTARDGASAIVTTANGRSYRTADGGRTWTLQENPAAPF